MKEYSFSEVERIIDTAYKSQFNRLRKYTPITLVRHAFSQFEMTRIPQYRDEFYSAFEDQSRADFFLDNHFGGMTYLVPWLLKSKGTKEITVLSKLEEVEFFKLTQLAVSYSYACIYFTHTYRKLYTHRIDSAKKVIIFTHKNPGDLRYKHYSDEVNKKILNEDAELQEELGIYRETYRIALESRAESLFVASDRMDISILLDNIYKHLNLVALVELSEDRLLGDYTKAQFFKIYSVILAIAKYDVALQFSVGAPGMPPYFPKPFECTYSLLVKSICKLSGVEGSTVKSILKDITFDAALGNQRISLRPFVVLNDYVVWSSSFVERGYVGVLYQNLVYKYRKSDYDNFQEELENHAVALLKENVRQISKGRLEVVHINAVLKIDTVKTPDITIFDRPNNRVLIIEYKYFISAHGAQDIASLHNSLAEGLKQLDRYVALPFKDGIHASGLLVTHHTIASPVQEITNKKTSIVSKRMLLDVLRVTTDIQGIVEFSQSLFSLDDMEVGSKLIGEFGEWSLYHPFLHASKPVKTYEQRLTDAADPKR